VKTQSPEWRKIFVSYSSDKGLMSIGKGDQELEKRLDQKELT
jgi:hypothetical protein